MPPKEMLMTTIKSILLHVDASPRSATRQVLQPMTLPVLLCH